jgi:hypothetical protein
MYISQTGRLISTALWLMKLKNDPLKSVTMAALFTGMIGHAGLK